MIDKPSLADEHWRAALRGRTAEDLDQDMVEAIETNHMWRLKVLLQLDGSWEEDMDSYIGACVEYGRFDMLKILAQKYPAAPTAQAAHHAGTAATAGHLDILRFFIESYDTEPQENKDDWLSSAASGGHAPVMEYLIGLGADVNSGLGRPLCDAMENGHFGAARLLLKNGADINAEKGQVLREAAERGDIAGVDFLLTAGAKPDMHDDRRTPLILAAHAGHLPVVERLLKGGADHTLFGYKAAMIAEQVEESAVLEALVRHERNCLETLSRKKQQEFHDTFSPGYSLDDLRNRRGPSGDTGLVIAAASGNFSSLAGRAGSGLAAKDLFHPADTVDTVLSILVRRNELPQFFAAPLWLGRREDLMQAYESLPEGLREKAAIEDTLAALDHDDLHRKLKKSVPKPPGL